MFPTLSHIIEYFTGIHLSLPFNTFGFFMAVAFSCAYWAFRSELKRKEQLGLVHAITKKVVVGKPAQFNELVLDGFLGFVIGFKLMGALLNYSDFMSNTEQYILSTNGNFMGGVGFAILFVYLTYRDKKKQELPTPKEITVIVHPHQMMWNILIWAAVAGIIGAKLFHNLEYWDDFARDPIHGLLSFSGLTFYGGLLAGAGAVIYYTRKQGINTWVMADVGAPGMMLAYGVGRIGCHLSGDGDWGIVNLHPKPTYFTWLPDWLWAYNYPNNVVNDGVAIANCSGKYCNMLPLPVYPTPFYEALICVMLFGLLWLLRKRITTTGMMLCSYLIVNGLERFLIEKIRVNSQYHAFGLAFTQAEMISFLMILSGVGGILYLLRNKQRTVKN